MVYFCKKCMKTHSDNELCPHIQKQIKEMPHLVNEAVVFANIAGQEHLISTQALDEVFGAINKISGTKIPSYEGTHQFVRDLQVFQRLNTEAYPNLGIFNSPELVQSYLENATPNQIRNLSAKLAGYGQEVDWQRLKQGQLKSFYEKSDLLANNAPGVDGETINRFTGETISRTSIKATQTVGGITTNVQGIVKSLKSGTLSPDEIIVGIRGTEKQLTDILTKEIAYARSIGDEHTAVLLTTAKDNLKIQEFQTAKEVREATERLKSKIVDGKAIISITGEEIIKKAVQGAVIGAVISLTISSITSYIRYKNGELTLDETFKEVGEATVKGALIGGAMGTITLFLPAGSIGFVAGVAIGIYLNAALINILDEVFGKGAYREILIASGCIMGTSMNLSEAMKIFAEGRRAIMVSSRKIEEIQAQIDAEQEKLNKNVEVL